MASEEEVRLGRLAVGRGFATEAQVVDALRARNAKPAGDDLGEILVARGLVPRAALAELRKAAAKGSAAIKADRADATTDHALPIQGTREVIARDQLEETLLAAKRDWRSAHKELVRLAREFPDTESGVAAAREARALEASHPELEAS
ncbi:hypothetical protein HY251_13070 [bacterium]|nr:hypothetical protein [bacterium]